MSIFRHEKVSDIISQHSVSQVHLLRQWTDEKPIVRLAGQWSILELSSTDKGWVPETAVCYTFHGFLADRWQHIIILLFIIQTFGYPFCWPFFINSHSFGVPSVSALNLWYPSIFEGHSVNLVSCFWVSSFWQTSWSDHKF